MSEFVPNLEKGCKHFIMHHFPVGTNCLPIHWMLRWTRQCCTCTVALDPSRSDSCVHYMCSSYVLLFKFKLLYDWMHWTITTPRHRVCVHALGHTWSRRVQGTRYLLRAVVGHNSSNLSSLVSMSSSSKSQLMETHMYNYGKELREA